LGLVLDINLIKLIFPTKFGVLELSTGLGLKK
jgi:hypothetical protein